MSRFPKRRKPPMPVRASMCATCPFREGQEEKYAMVQGVLIERVLTQASHICHQTGANNAFNKRTGKQQTLCRGARDLQLKCFAATGFIDSATDEAWNAKCREMNLPEIPVVKTPLPTIKRKPQQPTTHKPK